MSTTVPAGSLVWRAALLAVALTACLLLIAEPAAADPSIAASKFGRNIGSEIKAFGTAVLLGVVGLVGIPAIMKRDFAQGLTIVLLAVMIGGFLFAPNQVENVINGLWKAVAG